MKTLYLYYSLGLTMKYFIIKNWAAKNNCLPIWRMLIFFMQNRVVPEFEFFCNKLCVLFLTCWQFHLFLAKLLLTVFFCNFEFTWNTSESCSIARRVYKYNVSHLYQISIRNFFPLFNIFNFLSTPSLFIYLLV